MNLPKSSLKEYLRDGNEMVEALGLLCGFGNGLGGQAAGYAAAEAVQVSNSVFPL